MNKTIDLQKHLSHPVFQITAEICAAENIPCFVIGGFVRDIFLKRECKDIDLVVAGNGIDIAQKVAAKMEGNPEVFVFKNFGTAMFKINDLQIEFVGARKESYQKHSRKPEVESGSLFDDQQRRDFTINTMAIDLSKENFGSLVDPFNGLNDLEKKIIRTPLDAGITYSDDPLRMMRAIRFAAQLDFNIEKKSLDAILEKKDRITIVSMERTTDELNKIILSKTPSAGFKLLFDSGLLQIIFPQMTALHGVKYVTQ